ELRQTEVLDDRHCLAAEPIAIFTSQVLVREDQMPRDILRRGASRLIDSHKDGHSGVGRKKVRGIGCDKLRHIVLRHASAPCECIAKQLYEKTIPGVSLRTPGIVPPLIKMYPRGSKTHLGA